MTPLEAAYALFSPGSERFLDAVDFAGHYQVTRTEARHIALEYAAPRSGKERGRMKLGGRTVRMQANSRKKILLTQNFLMSMEKIHR